MSMTEYHGYVMVVNGLNRNNFSSIFYFFVFLIFFAENRWLFCFLILDITKTYDITVYLHQLRGTYLWTCRSYFNRTTRPLFLSVKRFTGENVLCWSWINPSSNSVYRFVIRKSECPISRCRLNKSPPPFKNKVAKL